MQIARRLGVAPQLQQVSGRCTVRWIFTPTFRCTLKWRWGVFHEKWDKGTPLQIGACKSKYSINFTYGRSYIVVNWMKSRALNRITHRGLTLAEWPYYVTVCDRLQRGAGRATCFSRLCQHCYVVAWSAFLTALQSVDRASFNSFHLVSCAFEALAAQPSTCESPSSPVDKVQGASRVGNIE